MPTPRGGRGVTCWGVGFNSEIKKRAGLPVCRELIERLKADGCSVMLGIPTGWRRQDRDALSDPHLHEVLLLADVLSPWAVGRFRDPAGALRHGERYWREDIKWARERGVDYMPVVFPGFSRHNHKGDDLGAIPRHDGGFLWSQILATTRAGTDMLYIAMFDEVDEGTAIFKCTNDPPTGNGATFLTLNGLPSDFYLRLAGEAGRLLRGEMPPGEAVPVPRTPDLQGN